MVQSQYFDNFSQNMGAKRCLYYKKKNSGPDLIPPQNLGATSDSFKIRDQNFKPPIQFAPSSWSGRLRSRNIQHIPDGRKVTECNTSDYGTASESSRKSSLIISGEDTCDWEQESGVSSLPVTPLTSDVESDVCEEHLSIGAWSDSEIETQLDSFENILEDYDVSQTFQNLKENGISVKLLHRDGVVVLLPNNNLAGDSDNKLRINRSTSYKPYSFIGTIHASLVISLEPHGTQLFGKYPAVIFLPLLILPGPTDKIECLFSNTPSSSRPMWEKLNEDQFRLSCDKVIISTNHSSLFTVVIRPEAMESCRPIRQRSGGRLRNAAAPGTEINFPRGSLQNDIVASVKVIFHDACDPCQWRALASPVVMVGPHGYQFAMNQPPVTVRLPLPDYKKICLQFPARLTVWQSNTSEKQAAFWEKLDVDIRIERDPIYRCYTATFPVYHFSFFKIMWDILSTSLFEAKMGMSHIYPFISFSMMCQAFMEENADSSRFGLEVICHRSDRRLPELTNYKHRVGASLKPKLIKPGKILVRLKSQLFEADIEAGEDPEMVKQEYDFRGRDFEKQYACRFKADVARGTFGKVTVERLVTGGSGIEPIFEFNLHKTGNENETTAPECSDRWSIVAIKELASTLRILEDQNWKTLARYIGFTRNEIKTKLQYSADPFLSMMNMYQARAGSPEEFLQALYAVSRELQIGGTMASPQRGGSQSGSSQGGSSPTGSHTSSQFSNSPIRKRGIWSSLAPWKFNKDEDSDTSGTQSTQEIRKRSHPGVEVVSQGSSKGKKDCSSQQQSGGSSLAKRSRRQYSDVSETVTSASSASENDDVAESVEVKGNARKVHRKVVRVSRKATAKPDNSDDECSTEKCKLDPRMLSDGDLWRVSSSMNNINWRALGRTLGLQESALVNIESSYRSAGCRECAYQMMLEWKGLKPKQCTVGSLFSGLTKENMNEVAKKMAAIEFGVSE